MAGARIPVPRLQGVSEAQFLQDLYPQRKPLVLEGIDLGPCTSKWTVDYLSQVGGKQDVKIHVAAVAQMDFITPSLWPGKAVEDHPKPWDPAPMWETRKSSWLLASDWLSSSHCSHLGSESSSD